MQESRLKWYGHVSRREDEYVGKRVVGTESLDIERLHMAALTWDAMFKSRRAAILADGGGGVL